jgi:hypothetical protein
MGGLHPRAPLPADLPHGLVASEWTGRSADRCLAQNDLLCKAIGMTEERVPAAGSPRELLLGTRELTRRVRRAQRGAWFPLVLLGLVAAGAAPFYRVGPHPRAICTAVAGRGPGGLSVGPGSGSGPGSGAVKCFVAFGWPAFIYWLVALAGAYVVITGFYVLRARRRGVGARIGPYAAAGLAGVALVAVLWLAQRYLGSQSRYPSALVVHGLNPLLAIGLALFVLAWAERSRALLVFAAANLAALLAGSYDIDGLLREHGWLVAMAWTFVPRLWAAASVLLLGGAAFAVAGRLRK